MTTPIRLGMLADKGVPCRSESRISGVYSLTNTVNGVRYIGSTVNLSQRWSEHRSAFRNGRVSVNRLVADDLEAFGIEAFAVELLERVAPDDEVLEVAERRWIEQYRGQVYNIVLSGHREPVKRRRRTAPAQGEEAG